MQKTGLESNVKASAASRATGDFRAIGQILSDQQVTRPSSKTPQRPRNAPESPYYPATGTTSHPAAETASTRLRGRQKSYPVPPDLELFTRDISAEFHDSSKLPSNLSFIGRVLHETGLHPSALYQLMQQARQLTKSKGNIEKPSEDDPGFRNRFPYFRQTLLDLVEKEGKAVSARRDSPTGPP